MKSIKCILFILAAVVLSTHAEIITGESLLTTDFAGGSTPNWTRSGLWIDDANNYLTYPITTTLDASWSLATGQCKDLSVEFAEYDLSQSKLMGFDTDNISFYADVVHQARLSGTAADYDIWLQIEVYLTTEAGGGFYRMGSAFLDPETTVTGTQTPAPFSWYTSGTLGAFPTAGVALEDIDHIQCMFVAHRNVQYDGANGAVYFLINNISVPYQVDAKIPFDGVEGETLINTNLVSGSGSVLIPDWTYPNTAWTWRNNVDPGGLAITVPQDHTHLAAQSSAVGDCKVLIAETDITAEPGYDSAVSRLMGFDMDRMSFETRTQNAYALPEGSVFLQMEVDVNLTGTASFYRLTSTPIDIDTLPKNATSTQTPTWSWSSDGGALGDLTAAGGVVLADIDSITYTIHLDKTADYTDANANSYLFIDKPMLPYQVAIVPDSPFEEWIGTHGLTGGDADANADPDGDGLSNLAEFGIGGNPTNAADRGTASICGTMDVGGTLYFGYVHPQLADPDSGLTYSLELCSDLAAGNWTNIGYSILGTNDTGGDLDMVTNYTDTVDDQKFIRLRIEE